MTNFYSGDPGDEHHDRRKRIPAGESGLRSSMIHHQPYEYEQLEDIKDAAWTFLKIYNSMAMQNHIDETDEIAEARSALEQAFVRRVAFRDA